MALVRNIVTDCKSGETREEWVERDASLDAAAAARAQVIEAERTNELTLRQQAEAALVDLRAYRDLASPTQAQTVQAVKLLCRVAIGLIRLALRKLDAVG